MTIRPRFSIRTLLVVVTLVASYFGCWEVTKRLGLGAVPSSDLSRLPVEHSPIFSLKFYVARFDSSPAPFVVSREPLGPVREYYFWFFGYTAKLPYERELPP